MNGLQFGVGSPLAAFGMYDSGLAPIAAMSQSIGASAAMFGQSMNNQFAMLSMQLRQGSSLFMALAMLLGNFGSSNNGGGNTNAAASGGGSSGSGSVGGHHRRRQRAGDDEEEPEVPKPDNAAAAPGETPTAEGPKKPGTTRPTKIPTLTQAQSDKLVAAADAEAKKLGTGVGVNKGTKPGEARAALTMQGGGADIKTVTPAYVKGLKALQRKYQRQGLHIALPWEKAPVVQSPPTAAPNAADMKALQVKEKECDDEMRKQKDGVKVTKSGALPKIKYTVNCNVAVNGAQARADAFKAFVKARGFDVEVVSVSQ